MKKYRNRIEIIRDEYKSSDINIFIPENILDEDYKLKYILLIDSPDMSDYKSGAYLSGRAGKTAKRIFSNYNFSNSFDDEVLILPKTAIVSQTPNDLILLQKKRPELFEEIQIIMAELLFEVYNEARPENVWILESPGVNSLSVFKTFYYLVKDMSGKVGHFDKALFGYTHFANNNFELEYLRYYYKNSFAEGNRGDFLYDLGKENIHKIFKNI